MLQPVPQWPVVVPHHPYCEQQFPNEDPWQVKPPVPAQVPSVETFLVVVVAVGVAALVVVAPDEEPQVPNADWQLVPQWSVVLPHQPYWEQQLPKVEPWQVNPLVPAQVPSVETFLVVVVPVGVEGFLKITEVLDDVLFTSKTKF